MYSFSSLTSTSTPRFKSFATLCSSSFSTAEKRLSRSVDLCATLSSRLHVDGVDVYATIQNEGAVKFPFMHAGVDESSLGAFLTAFFEAQAPMVQSDGSAEVNRAQDARTAARHANRFLSKFVI